MAVHAVPVLNFGHVLRVLPQDFQEKVAFWIAARDVPLVGIRKSVTFS